MPRAVSVLIVLMAELGCAAWVAWSQQVTEEQIEEISPPALRAPRDTPRADIQKAREILVRESNAFRRAEGRSALRVNRHLSAAAQEFAEYMAEHNRYGHTADDQEPSDRAKAQGYEPCIVAENIAYQYRSTGFVADPLAESFLTGWKESPGHRRNLLDKDVTETGVGVAYSPATEHYYGVQLFGRPRSQSIRFEIANEANATVRYQLAGRKFELPPRFTRTHEICRASPLTFLPPESVVDDEETAKPGATVRPRNGERFVVTSAAGGDVKFRRETVP